VLLPFRLGLFFTATTDANAIIVLGFDLRLVGQPGKVQTSLFVDGPPLLVETGTAALPQPAEKGHVAAGAILVSHWHTVDQGVGEPLDWPQGACLTEFDELLAFFLVRQPPGAAWGHDEVLRQPVGQETARELESTARLVVRQFKPRGKGLQAGFCDPSGLSGRFVPHAEAWVALLPPRGRTADAARRWRSW